MSNASLAGELFSQLQNDGGLSQIADQLGIDPSQATGAIAASLPVLMGALGHNAQQPGGADAIFNALQRDHMPAMGGSDGGGFDLGGLLGPMLGGLMGGSGGGAASQFDGGGILGHILGGNQQQAQSQLGQAAGMNAAQMGQILQILAPIVMGFLAHRVNAQGMDAGGLGSVLGQQRDNHMQGGGLGDLLGAALGGMGGGGNAGGGLGGNILGNVLGSLLGGRR